MIDLIVVLQFLIGWDSTEDYATESSYILGVHGTLFEVDVMNVLAKNLLCNDDLLGSCDNLARFNKITRILVQTR